MINRSKNIILLSAILYFFVSPIASYAWHDYAGYGDWDYYGSGRDHPYSAYIDRHYYVGPSDYATIKPDFIDGPIVFQNLPTAPGTSPVLLSPPATVEEYNVNIPNVHGGFNTVVIKKDGEGFLGPDGEYYPEFPKVFQLQMKYGN